MLILSRKTDESIMIGDDIEVKIIDLSGRVIKLGIEAPKNIIVHRKEIYDAIKNENLQALGKEKAKENIISLAEFYKNRK